MCALVTGVQTWSLPISFLFDGHPYERPIGGSIADLDRAELADVRAFHEAYYRPDNAVFVISGNFDPARLDRWVDRYLGSIARPSRAIPRDAAAGKPVGARTVDAYAPNVPLPALVAAWRAPFARDADAAGIDLIEAILTRGASSRMRRALVDDPGVASVIARNNLPVPAAHGFSLVMTLAKGRVIPEPAATHNATSP